jgi:hypothetical protein
VLGQRVAEVLLRLVRVLHRPEDFVALKRHARRAPKILQTVRGTALPAVTERRDHLEG